MLRYLKYLIYIIIISHRYFKNMYDQYAQDNVILLGNGNKVDPGLQMSNSASETNNSAYDPNMH